jgi:hypothetical protein
MVIIYNIQKIFKKSIRKGTTLIELASLENTNKNDG